MNSLPNEEDDTKDVLDARKEDSHDGAELSVDHRLGVRVGRAGRNGCRVVGQHVDGLRDVRPVLEVILERSK